MKEDCPDSKSRRSLGPNRRHFANDARSSMSKTRDGRAPIRCGLAPVDAAFQHRGKALGPAYFWSRVFTSLQRSLLKWQSSHHLEGLQLPKRCARATDGCPATSCSMQPRVASGNRSAGSTKCLTCHTPDLPSVKCEARVSHPPTKTNGRLVRRQIALQTSSREIILMRAEPLDEACSWSLETQGQLHV